MNNYSRWTATVISITFILLTITCGIQHYIDEYGFFWRSEFKYNKNVNHRFAITKDILNNHKQYNSYMFGSSRIGGINPKFAEKHVENSKFYNSVFPEGLPYEYYHHVKFLISQNIKIKNLLIGLDDFSWTINPDVHIQNLTFHPYPPSIGKNLILFRLKSLIRIPNFGRLMDPKNSRIKRNKAPWEMTRARPEGAKINEKLFEKAFLQISPFNDHLKGALDEMTKLVELCKENDISLKIFIQPIYKKNYCERDDKVFFAFIEKLARITPYYNFSNMNTITIDTSYFIEPVHYYPIVGEYIIRTIYGSKEDKSDIPNDFGFYVTKNNVKDYIKKLQNEKRLCKN